MSGVTWAASGFPASWSPGLAGQREPGLTGLRFGGSGVPAPSPLRSGCSWGADRAQAADSDSAARRLQELLGQGGQGGERGPAPVMGRGGRRRSRPRGPEVPMSRVLVLGDPPAALREVPNTRSSSSSSSGAKRRVLGAAPAMAGLRLPRAARFYA